MASENPSGITITLKGGAGYEAPWIVIHAETVAEGGAILEELRRLEAFAAVRDAAREFHTPNMSQAAREIQNVFPGSQTHEPGQVWAGNRGGQELPQQYQGGEVCAHGPMKYIAQGKYGPFWACPADRDDPNRCKARNAN